MSLVLVDDSLSLCENGLSETAYIHSITCNIFLKPERYQQLPMIRYAGDIVRLSNVQKHEWNGEIQLVSSRDSTFVTLRGKDTRSDGTQTRPEMFPSDDDNVVLSDMEWQHMLDMWHWAQRRIMLHATMKIAHRFRLSDMHLPDSTHTEAYGEQNTRGDLTAMVAAIIPIVSDLSLAGVTPHGFIRVWDGTGIPKSDILPVDSEEAKEAVRDGDPPPAALMKIANIVHKLQELRQNKDIQPPTKLSGRVANVAIWEKQHWELMKQGYVTIGSFIRLRNVQDSVYRNTNFRCLHVHEKSSLTPLPNLTFEVLHLLEEHNNRLLRMEPTNNDSGLLPLLVTNSIQDTNGTIQQHQPHSLLQNRSPHRITELTNPHRGASIINSPTSVPISSTCYSNFSDFMKAPVPSIFYGEVNVVAIYPSVTSMMDHGIKIICPIVGPNFTRMYRFGLEVLDMESNNHLSVIISDNRPNTSVGAKLFGMSCVEAISNPQPIYDMLNEYLLEHVYRNAKITSVAYDDSTYFLLDYLQ
jgi:hypothetical protein